MANIWSKNKGVYFGFGADRYTGPAPKTGPATEIRYVGDRHLVTVGPNGSGKSRRLLLPNLAELVGWSTLVVDPKGELACMTSKHREAHSKIVRLNPFDCLGLGSDGFNPIAALDPDDVNFPDDAMGLAEAIIRVEGNDPHWSQSAQDLVCALIMYVRLVRPDPSLLHVRSLLGISSGELSALVASPDFMHDGLAAPGMIEAADFYDCPELAIKAKRFRDAGPENREINSVVSTALTQTRWLDSRQIKKDLSEGNFDFSIMKREPTTVYLILPANRLGTHSNWLRLMITSVLQPLMRDTRKSDVPIIFMLDEFAQLGHLPIIERTMAMMRGYGIKLWTVVQDLSQLKAIYNARWESFLGNAGVLQSFGPQDVFTSDYLSKLTGLRTFTPLAAGDAGPEATLSMSQVQRPLMLPQEVRGMGEGFSLLYSHKLSGTAAISYFPYPTALPHMKEICALDPSQ